MTSNLSARGETFEPGGRLNHIAPAKPRAGHLVREMPGDAAAGGAPPRYRCTNDRVTPRGHQVDRRRCFPSSVDVASAPDVLGEWMAPESSAGHPWSPMGRPGRVCAKNAPRVLRPAAEPPPAYPKAPFGTRGDYRALVDIPRSVRYGPQALVAQGIEHRFPNVDRSTAPSGLPAETHITSAAIAANSLDLSSMGRAIDRKHEADFRPSDP
jgi:hypothetical protein